MTVPAFHRAVLIEPRDGLVEAAVEDDYHHMRVALHHDGERVTGVEATMIRAPWSTCPGAQAALCDSFTGMALAQIAAAGGKRAHCTHLFDLTLWAAAHVADSHATRYDAEVTDPMDGERRLRLTCDNAPAMEWIEHDGKLVEPRELAGKSLFELRDWISGQTKQVAEKAKILQWAGILAHGRQIPLARQSDASRMPPNCFTFQPERAAQADRVGEIRDFSGLSPRPLDRIN